MWLNIIVNDIKIRWEGPPIKLYCDKRSARSIAHNPVQRERTKHVRDNMHFIKEKLDSSVIYTPFVPTSAQLADVLTKGWPE